MSQDLLKKNGGPLDYGDIVYIDKIGFKVVNDTMNKRHKRHLDVWVPDLKSEKEFDKKYKCSKLKVFLVRRK